ncbi:DegT/DnrJ/EryC1/StrS family aminotransferase [candidate division WS5 bacterium]|uniref:DegT/DnrJ/EryC1/StrS family aminotransferase n=1 Tax=candidate division WS5 bacterium TaxID=2093353 RepID=A0A419DC68_9BACT|nr:MAG: DegT/DnrJ/EryC1/StrS family aminotransferase [candidate division WS5 bacterium]
MAIKVWDYLREYENEKEEIHAAIERVLKSGSLILGENVRNFEREFANYCDVSFGVGVNSGTDAIFLGLKALGVGAGDEVITVANTAVPTVSAIVSAGATPVFVDINPDTYLMDTSLLENLITKRTRCILPVHLYGQCVDMDDVRKAANKHGLKILEDCAQSHGASFKGKKAGSMSDIAAFSFYPTKVLGGFGDGGMVITNNEELYKKLKRLRFYGMEKTYYAEDHGYNSRLDELHAAILLSKLTHIDEYIERRRFLAEQYNKLLFNSGLTLPKTMQGNQHVYYLYVCRNPGRDNIIAELKRRDILVNISYPWPIHTMTGYKFLGYKTGDLPHTEKAAREIFSLPMYPSLTNEEQMIVADALHDILSKIN